MTQIRLPASSGEVEGSLKVAGWETGSSERVGMWEALPWPGVPLPCPQAFVTAVSVHNSVGKDKTQLL